MGVWVCGCGGLGVSFVWGGMGFEGELIGGVVGCV